MISNVIYSFIHFGIVSKHNNIYTSDVTLSGRSLTNAMNELGPMTVPFSTYRRTLLMADGTVTVMNIDEAVTTGYNIF